MRQDVTITIFGKIETAEALGELAEAAASEGSSDWGSGGFGDEGEAAEYIIDASAEGDEVSLCRQDTYTLFNEVTSVCRERGLSYVMLTGDTGSEGFDTMHSWAPGMEKQFECPCDNEKPYIPLSDVQRALKGGLDGIKALAQKVEAQTLLKASKKLEVSKAAIDAYMADDETSPDQAAI